MSQFDGGAQLKRLRDAADAIGTGRAVGIAEAWLSYALADAHEARERDDAADARQTELIAGHAFLALLSVRIEDRLLRQIAELAHRVGAVEVLLAEHEQQADEITDRAIAVVRELNDNVVAHDRWAEQMAEQQVGRMQELVTRVARIEHACPGLTSEQ